MKRMLANRSVLLAAIVVCATALVGAAGLFSRPGRASMTAAAKPAAVPIALAVKEQPVQDPRCADQDKDDDAKASKLKGGKPDLDDIELECGDQNDDDGGVNEDNDRHHEGRGKALPEKTPGGGEAAKSPIRR